MKMLDFYKRLLILVALLLSCTCHVAEAQNYSKDVMKDLEKAENLVASGDVQKAIRIYKNLLNRYENDTTLMLSLARTYSAASEHDKALYWIGEVVENPEIRLNETLVKLYVRELRLAGRYEIAKIWLEKIKLDLFSENDSSTSQPVVFFQDSAYIKITSIDANSAASDFCPVFYKSSLLFYSNRNLSNTKSINLAGDAAADLFATSPGKEYPGNNPKLINELMGYGHYEGSFAFYNNFQQSILSKYMIDGSDLVTGQNKLSGLRLYTAQVDTQDNIIDFFNALPFNIHGYSVAHPNISEDGKVLFFASNIPGGLGGSDIYRSDFKNGSWSPPVNLGPQVNSAYDEYFPYNYKGHTLFFTSNRPGGVGKFDMYKQKLVGLSENEKPLNLGIPVNSADDDFCLIVTGNGKSGYFTSNRPESKGKEDIFRFELKMVSIQEVIDEILADDQFNHVKVNAARRNTIIVEPLRNAGNPDNQQNEQMQDQQGHGLAQWDEPEKANFDTDVELKLQNPNVTLLDSVELDDKNLAYQQVQILIRNNGKIIYQSKLPEELNLSSFFDVKHEIKKSLGQLYVPDDDMEPVVDDHANTVFRVQIAASKKPISREILKKMYTGDREIFEFSEEGWFKYAIGDFQNYFIAARLKETCGVDDAFIAAYTGDQKRPLMKAIKNVHSNNTAPSSSLPATISKKVEVFFNFNDIEIQKNMISALDEVSALVQTQTDLAIHITGYADFFGSEDFNNALAKARAEAVKSYLLTKGIRNDCIEIEAKGKIIFANQQPDVFSYDKNDEAPYRKAEIIVYRR